MEGEREDRRPQGRRRLRVAAAAEYLDVSQHTLRRWADAGVVPCRRSPSGQRQFRPGDLTRFLAECEGRAGGHRATTAGSDARRPLDDAGRAQVVLDAGRAVARADDPRDALAVIARRVAESLDAPVCLVYELDELLDALVCRAMHGPGADLSDLRAGLGDELAGDPGGHAWPLASLPAERGMLESGEPLLDDSRLCVPFGVGPSASGCIVVADRRTARRFSPGEAALVRDVGHLAALAVLRDQTTRRQSEQAARMQSLLHAGRSITSSLVLQEVLDAVAREVVDILGAQYCVIWEYVPDEDALVERACFGISMDGDVVLLEERPREREILFSPEPVLETLSDPGLHPSSRASMEEWGEKTCLSLPLHFGDQALGMLGICETERERRFTAEEVDLARGLATQAAAAVHNARVYRDLERRNEELVARARRERLLNELSLELSSSLDPRTVLDSASRQICAILEGSACAIYSYRDDESLECLAGWAVDGDFQGWIGRRFSLKEWAASRRAIDFGTPVTIASLDDPLLTTEERELLGGHGQRALLVAPMRARDRILGAVEVTRAEGARAFSVQEVATAEACAHMAAMAIDNATLFERQAEHSQRLASLLVAGRSITSSLVIEEVLAALVHTAAASLGCPEALIFEFDEGADTLTMRSVFQEDPSIYEELDRPYPLDDYPSDRALLEQHDIVVETISDPSLPPDVRESMERHGEKTCLTVPLRFGARRLGMLTLVETADERVFSEADLEFARGLGEQAAMAMHNAQLFENVKGLHLGNLRALSSALTAKDFYTIGHTARVAAYAVLLAGELGWSPRAIQQLEEATYLHDIGKIAVADRVLLKSGTLTEEEWALMKQHPTISAEIIEALLGDEYVAGVRHHHERFDGSGYPDGLAGEAIPLIARLLCLVDSYDAMSSRRVYSPALTYEECLKELRKCSGTQFDPQMVDAFVRVLAGMAEQRQVLQAAADEAAARIDAADHLSLRRPEDRERAGYARILSVLQETRRAHPDLRSLVTESPVDELRCMIVVDSDEDPETTVPVGEVAFSGDLELETFAGRSHQSNVVYVDRWGTWIAAAAPIRAEDGTIVGLTSACRSPREGLPASAGRSAVSDTFSEIMRTAAARQTRAEIESMTDALTGLYNHRRFHECLREKVDAAPPGRRGSIALLFCDIDHFKLLNDRYGHLMGDDVLRRVSRILTASIRRGDVAARYGGDEFGVLLHDADIPAALEVAERIRARVAELYVAPGDGGISISIGVAALGEDGDGKDLLASADTAMYAAKDGGRDRVVRADTLESARPHLAPRL